MTVPLVAFAAFGWLSSVAPAGAQQTSAVTSGDDNGALLYEVLPMAAPDSLTAPPSAGLQRLQSVLARAETPQGGAAVTSGEDNSALLYEALPMTSADRLTAPPSAGVERLQSALARAEMPQGPAIEAQQGGE
jgi:hypothetical protein